MDDNPVFIDTNILVYANIITAPKHDDALAKIQNIYQSKRPIWISRQVLREYLVIMTRDQTFTAPMPKDTIIQRLEYFKNNFNVADDNETVTEELLKLITKYNFGGKQIHDANIVATMKAYNIDCLLTNNVKDFRKFQDTITIETI